MAPRTSKGKAPAKSAPAIPHAPPAAHQAEDPVGDEFQDAVNNLFVAKCKLLDASLAERKPCIASLGEKVVRTSPS